MSPNAVEIFSSKLRIRMEVKLMVTRNSNLKWKEIAKLFVCRYYIKSANATWQDFTDYNTLDNLKRMVSLNFQVCSN